MDIIERLLALSHFGSRWVLWLLIVLSIAALAVVIERRSEERRVGKEC